MAAVFSDVRSGVAAEHWRPRNTFGDETTFRLKPIGLRSECFRIGIEAVPDRTRPESGIVNNLVALFARHVELEELSLASGFSNAAKFFLL